MFDMFLMPFYGFMGRYIGDNLSNFMTQYEATRTLSETVLESIPQLCLQVYMVVYCRLNECNFQAEEGGDAALAGSRHIDLEHCVPFGDDVLRDAEGKFDPSGVRDAAGPYGGWIAAC